MENVEKAPALRLDKWMVPAAAVGLIGTGVTLGMHFTKQVPNNGALHSYFFAFIFWVALTIGCYGVTLLHHTIRPTWSLSILRIMEAGGGIANIVLMAALFLPIAISIPELYEWARPAVVAADPVLQHKARYLNPQFWLIRAAIYFLIWGITAFVLRKSSLTQDRTGDPNEAARRINMSAPLLVVFVITVNFAWTDWIMSLMPHWYSTIFGVIGVVGGGLIAIAFGAIIVTLNAGKAPYNEVVSPQLTKDLGNMLFTFTLLWAYTTLSQWIIIWSGNLPEFTRYFVARREGPFLYIGAMNVLCQWFIPFVWLLAPITKRIPGRLALVAAWIIVFRFSDIYYTVKPFFAGTGASLISWLDIVALAGVGGLWIAVFSSQIRQASLLPSHDQRLQEALTEAHDHA